MNDVSNCVYIDYEWMIQSNSFIDDDINSRQIFLSI